MCGAAAAVSPQMGLGIWCWATRWWSDVRGQVNSSFLWSPSPPQLLLHRRQTENNDLFGNVAIFGYQACPLRGTLLCPQSAKQSRAPCVIAGAAERRSGGRWRICFLPQKVKGQTCFRIRRQTWVPVWVCRLRHPGGPCCLFCVGTC